MQPMENWGGNMLINPQRKQYMYFSRYQISDYYYDTTAQKYWMANSYWLKDTTPYILHTVERGETYDSIALDSYANPTYWWIIADFNRVLDPFENPKEGSVIKVPIFSNLDFDT